MKKQTTVKSLSELAKIVQAHARINTTKGKENTMDKNKSTSDVALSAMERAELEELRAKAYIREHHSINNEDAVDYLWFRSSQTAEKEGISIIEASDKVLEENPEYRDFRFGVTKSKSAYVDTYEPPTRPSDRYGEQWRDADKAIDMLRRHESTDAIDFMRQRTEERKHELAGKLFGSR